MCWSGGGPSTYRLAAIHPERVQAIVASAAVSKPYEFAKGMAGIESSLMAGGLGHWMLHELAEHMPKTLVKSTLSEEGTLTKAETAALLDHVWNDPDARDFVLELSATISGRRTHGLKNDHARFPDLDLDLGAVAAPVLLVHGTADSDVPPEYSEHALRSPPDGGARGRRQGHPPRGVDRPDGGRGAVAHRRPPRRLTRTRASSPRRVQAVGAAPLGADVPSRREHVASIARCPARDRGPDLRPRRCSRRPPAVCRVPGPRSPARIQLTIRVSVIGDAPGGFTVYESCLPDDAVPPPMPVYAYKFGFDAAGHPTTAYAPQLTPAIVGDAWVVPFGPGRPR